MTDLLSFAIGFVPAAAIAMRAAVGWTCSIRRGERAHQRAVAEWMEAERLLETEQRITSRLQVGHDHQQKLRRHRRDGRGRFRAHDMVNDPLMRERGSVA